MHPRLWQPFRTGRQKHKGEELIDFKGWGSLEHNATLSIHTDKNWTFPQPPHRRSSLLYIFSLSIRSSSTGDNNKTRSIYQNTITLKILYCKHHWIQLKNPVLFLGPQQPRDRPKTSPSVEHLTYQAVLQKTLSHGLISDPHTLNHNWFYFIFWQIQTTSGCVCSIIYWLIQPMWILMLLKCSS